MSKLNFHKPKLPSTFSACCRSVVYLSMAIYTKKNKINKGFWQKTSIFPIRKIFFTDLAKEETNPCLGLIYDTKWIIYQKRFWKLVCAFQKYHQKLIFEKRAHSGTGNLFYEKKWGKSYPLMGYRCRVAQSGASWLKMELYGFHHRKWVEKPARNWIFVLFFLWSI